MLRSLQNFKSLITRAIKTYKFFKDFKAKFADECITK